MTAKIVNNAQATVVKLSAEGEAWLAAHPLFGDDAKLPKTAATLKDLAKQVSDGLITSAEADEKAEAAVNSELASLDEDTHRKLVEHAQQAQFDEIMAELIGDGRVNA